MSLGKATSSLLNLSKQRNCVNVRSLFSFKQKQSTSKLIAKEKKFSANNYEPIPVVLAKAEGVHVWDPEGKEYLDFLGGYAAMNTGHAHPKLLKVLKDQAATLTHSSRAYFNNVFPEYAEFICQYFGYDKVLPMNTGVETGESAVKIARRWGYTVKKIPQGKALIVFPEGNFWGRTVTAISTSTTPSFYENFGPFTPGFGLIPYNDLTALEEVLKNPNVCAYFMEPIQGEGGVVIPSPGYLKEVRRLCNEYNVLWIADEVQTGLGRTGQLLACDHECVRPDILLLGKGLAGGIVPVSAVLANKNVMDVLTPGSHGSTFGGNPLGARLAIATLSLIQEEGLIENAAAMGEKFRKHANCLLPKEYVVEIRGKGLMNAITLNTDLINAWDLCLKLKDAGLLCKNTDNSTVRFTPPLMIKESEILKGVEIINQVFQKMKGCS